MGSFPCHRCGRVYSHYPSRQRHLKYECGKQPTFACAFENCAYKAKRKQTLKIHIINQHSGHKRKMMSEFLKKYI
ncbi:hypothetical protein NQ317_012439 [Molorchus minor]|uniref:C2H2-type domain-containing protein n=1 Tax=Molorchus minor TaxID=1323400 RepID=A0ABQ9JVQ1_9CUCU|nr:hypothetical protein NQ317_012439 [Molorchus minor]